MFLFQLPWLPEFIVRRRDWALLVRALRDTSAPGLFSDSDLEQYKESWARKGALAAMVNSYRAALLRPSKLALDRESSRVKLPVLLIWGKVRRIGSNTKRPQTLITCYPNSSPN
jgi:hypothetical protein